MFGKIGPIFGLFCISLCAISGSRDISCDKNKAAFIPCEYFKELLPPPDRKAVKVRYWFDNRVKSYVIASNACFNYFWLTYFSYEKNKDQKVDIWGGGCKQTGYLGREGGGQRIKSLDTVWTSQYVFIAKSSHGFLPNAKKLIWFSLIFKFNSPPINSSTFNKSIF